MDIVEITSYTKIFSKGKLKINNNYSIEPKFHLYSQISPIKFSDLRQSIKKLDLIDENTPS